MRSRFHDAAKGGTGVYRRLLLEHLCAVRVLMTDSPTRSGKTHANHPMSDQPRSMNARLESSLPGSRIIGWLGIRSGRTDVSMPNRAAGKLSLNGMPDSAVGITPARSWWKGRRAQPTNSGTRDYENHCDSFCDRREANRGDWMRIGIPARTDLLAFWHHRSILDWLVVPVAEGSNPSTHPTTSKKTKSQSYSIWAASQQR